jgi:hypothetical protein
MNPDNPNFRTPEESQRAEELVRAKERIRKLREALEKIIAMNVQYAFDRYGDRSKAETMACVVESRQALQQDEAGR